MTGTSQPSPSAGTRSTAAGASRRSGGGLLRDMRLWVTVGLVAVFALAWQVGFLLFGTPSGTPISPNTANFLPFGVFLVPVLYAAITFGYGGGMVVAATSAVATLPWAIRSVLQQDQIGAWFDVVQVVVLLVVAYFVGRGVRAERQARQAAERSRQDHVLAEVRYRDLFDTNSQPILLVDLSGVVQEANVAAGELFGCDARSLTRATLPELIGSHASAAVRQGGPSPGTVEIPAPVDGTPGTTYRPVARMVAIDGQPMLQVVLQDVTEDARRRRQAQAYAADVLRGQEDERRRIAQDLHDGPLQTLVHVCRLIDAVSANGQVALPHPRGGAGVDVSSTLAELREATESAVAEVRQISRGLRPPLLDDLGLVAALERLCDEVEHRAGVAASLRVDGPIAPLPPVVELTVYRVAQEALSNVDRHAGASCLDVCLSTTGEWLQLRVTDDGEGFDLPPVGGIPGRERLGLPGMADRAELVGGSLQVQSDRGQGTTVTLAVPVGALAETTPAPGDAPTSSVNGSG